jgi:acyl-CoA reductase-like NAD-dependent aldehyde dehydrogenase
MAIAEAAAPALLERAIPGSPTREVEGARGAGARRRQSRHGPALRRGDAPRRRAERDGEWEAVDAARAAFPAWSARTLPASAGSCSLRVHDLCWSRRKKVAALIAREQGKPAAEAHLVEVFPALEALDHLARHAEELLRDDAVESHTLLLAHKDARLVYAPLGVVLAITPWNYPFSISLTNVAAALIAGNTVVLKPAPATDAGRAAHRALFRQAALPEAW